MRALWRLLELIHRQPTETHVNILRHIPVLGLLVPISADEYANKRREDAAREAEKHRRGAIEMRDAAAWALAVAKHHDTAYRLYQERAKWPLAGVPLE